MSFNVTVAEGGKLTTTCDNATQYVAAIHAFETKGVRCFVVRGFFFCGDGYL